MFLLAAENLQTGLFLYLAQNRKAYYARFKNYLRTELFGGTKGYCREHSIKWFDDVVLGEVWALQSKKKLRSAFFCFTKNVSAVKIALIYKFYKF